MLLVHRLQPGPAILAVDDLDLVGEAQRADRGLQVLDHGAPPAGPAGELAHDLERRTEDRQPQVEDGRPTSSVRRGYARVPHGAAARRLLGPAREVPGFLARELRPAHADTDIAAHEVLELRVPEPCGGVHPRGPQRDAPVWDEVAGEALAEPVEGGVQLALGAGAAHRDRRADEHRRPDGPRPLALHLPARVLGVLRGRRPQDGGTVLGAEDGARLERLHRAVLRRAAGETEQHDASIVQCRPLRLVTGALDAPPPGVGGDGGDGVIEGLVLRALRGTLRRAPALLLLLRLLLGHPISVTPRLRRS